MLEALTHTLTTACVHGAQVGLLEHLRCYGLGLGCAGVGASVAAEKKQTGQQRKNKTHPLETTALNPLMATKSMSPSVRSPHKRVRTTHGSPCNCTNTHVLCVGARYDRGVDGPGKHPGPFR